MLKIKHLLRKALCLFFPLALLCVLFLSPAKSFANSSEFSPEVTSVVETFSERFCLSINQGESPENAARKSVRSIIGGLISSSTFKEVIDTPKEDMALFVANNIFNQCGDEIKISQEEMNSYLLSLSNNNPSGSTPKPFKPFGIG